MQFTQTMFLMTTLSTTCSVVSLSIDPFVDAGDACGSSTGGSDGVEKECRAGFKCMSQSDYPEPPNFICVAEDVPTMTPKCTKKVVPTIALRNEKCGESVDTKVQCDAGLECTLQEQSDEWNCQFPPIVRPGAVPCDTCNLADGCSYDLSEFATAETTFESFTKCSAMLPEECAIWQEKTEDGEKLEGLLVVCE